MSKEKKSVTKTTTATTQVKRGPGRPKKAATPPVPKSMRKLATAKRAAKPVAKKPSEKAQATRELNKAVKGTHARGTTTPALYDAKAAFEMAQSQINTMRRKYISQSKEIAATLKAADDLAQGVLGEIDDLQAYVDKQVAAYNAEVRKPVEAAVEAKKSWYKKLRGGRA